MSRKFQRRVEDFVCANCGREVQGDGYTNHCPNCLWSRHVDVNPGDRAESCGGGMRPTGIETKGALWTLVHECVVCGTVRRCRTAEADSREAVLAIARAAAEGASGRKRK
ncbi:MAG: RNHCP domain-containing protein [Alphaproteobacteria bacterium]|nr:RNHCP domain-containing protein [Alphaproteobacteria bacterium]